MTLDQLRIFVAVAEREHMTRAAEALNQTQSATSAAIAALEEELLRNDRTKDYQYFIENKPGCWHVAVLESDDGELQGAVVSIIDPGSKMLGPGLAREPDQLGALITHELNQRRGETLVLLLPVDCPELAHRMYALGARNCELHFSQVRGEMPPSSCAYMPTFMPETG